MELMELYDQIQNPIDDPKTIEKLITAYANSSKSFGGFYGLLVKTIPKQYKRQFYQEDADKFYAMMFNKWKNSVLAMTRDEFLELYKKRSFGKDFVKMRAYLKTIPDVSTMKEADDIFYGKKDDKELEEALEKYRWNSFGNVIGWVHVCSRYVTAKKDKYIDVKHRLYLDTEALDTYKLITHLVEKFDEHHLPYYFKFDPEGARDDTVVIYSSTENLMKYLELLQEIKKEHPDLVARFKDPPALTGKIDSWIGYGSEPRKAANGSNQSFNGIRAPIIESILGKVTKQWILSHRNMQITYQGQRLSFQDYVAMKSTEAFISKLIEHFDYYEESAKNIAKKHGTVYNPADVVEKMGLTIEDINSPQLKDNIYKIIRKHMETALPKICNGNYKDVDELPMNVRHGKKITFRGSELEAVIQSLSVNIARNDPTFIPTIQTEIKNSARQHGIDINKFCFDTRVLEEMRKISTQHEDQKQTELERQQTELKRRQAELEQRQAELEQAQKQDIELNNQPSAMESIEFMDSQSLPNIINPTLIERKMKLPNGAEIPAKQYIQDIVYPHLPKDGVVILSNGSTLSVKQFIEECVMFDCQEKYNGDFPRYLAENTRNNLGIINIETSFEKHQIDPTEITEYINPELLGKRMKLPNGAEISARQYIQEIFAPHIPIDGNITLANGITIPATQYIEESLLFEGQEKYNGDINQILFNTTRNNNGRITADPKKVQETLIKLKNPSAQDSSAIRK